MTDPALNNVISQNWQPSLEDFTPRYRIEAELYWEQNTVVSSTSTPMPLVRLHCGDTLESQEAEQLRPYARAA